ncbi:MAG: hypothetical protein WBC44_01285 [Planctomycetaceae bacterium]
MILQVVSKSAQRHSVAVCFLAASLAGCGGCESRSKILLPVPPVPADPETFRLTSLVLNDQEIASGGTLTLTAGDMVEGTGKVTFRENQPRLMILQFIRKDGLREIIHDAQSVRPDKTGKKPEFSVELKAPQSPGRYELQIIAIPGGPNSGRLMLAKREVVVTEPE